MTKSLRYSVTHQEAGLVVKQAAYSSDEAASQEWRQIGRDAV